MKKYRNLIAKEFKIIRQEKSITQEDAANVELDVRTYRRIENGETVPNLMTLIHILVNMDITISEFFKRIEDRITKEEKQDKKVS